MQIGVAGEFEGEPARLILIEGRDSTIFFQESSRRPVRRVHTECHGVALEDAASARQQTKHLLATIEPGETEERLLRDLRPVRQLRR